MGDTRIITSLHGGGLAACMALWILESFALFMMTASHIFESRKQDSKIPYISKSVKYIAK
jgi:hypothetical protein